MTDTQRKGVIHVSVTGKIKMKGTRKKTDLIAPVKNFHSHSPQIILVWCIHWLRAETEQMKISNTRS